MTYQLGYCDFCDRDMRPIVATATVDELPPSGGQVPVCICDECAKDASEDAA